VILEFHPAAADELAAAVGVGEERSSGLGPSLLAETRRVAALLCEMPELGQRLDGRHRRFPLRRFPYGLIFRVDGDRSRVIALAHRRQEPGYWRNRR
jgi:hypothetical protein